MLLYHSLPDDERDDLLIRSILATENHQQEIGTVHYVSSEEGLTKAPTMLLML